MKLYFSPSCSCSVCLHYFNFLSRSRVLEISVPILKAKTLSLLYLVNHFGTFQSDKVGRTI